MLRAILLLLFAATASAAQTAIPTAALHEGRASVGDLEVGGELRGVPGGATRYLRDEDLLHMPQETYSVTDDSNLKPKTEVSGVALDTLVHLFAQSPDSAFAVAICYDKYRANYPRDYLDTHHPLLVLRINGQLRDHWPQSEYGGSLGPYLISHPFFKPAFKVLSHEDEPQVPFGITRIEIRREAQVFGAIRPRGNWPPDSPVAQGYLIARQDCFRCHNMHGEGGTMAGRSWLELARIAHEDGERFRHIIRNPAAVTPGAKMPAHADYDDATLDALRSYFNTFAASGASLRRRQKP